MVELQNKHNGQNSNNEFTLKEIILQIQKYWNVLWSKKWGIIIIASIVALYFGVSSYLSDLEYNAQITYMVNEDGGSSGGVAGAAALLGQFGFGGGGGEFNLAKIVALGKSKNIIAKALVDTSYQPLIADRLIEYYDLHERWQENDLLKDFKFDNSKNTLSRNLAINVLVSLIRGGGNEAGLTSYGFAEETGILEIVTMSVDPELSIDLSASIYDKLSKFYVSEAVERPQKNYSLLEERADSISQELGNVEAQIYRYQDQSRDVVLTANRAAFNKLKRKAQILAIMQGEILKNKETAEFILKSETPFFQVIDQTQPPIYPAPKSVVKNSIFGAVIGGTFAAIIFIGQFLYREAMDHA